ncbi:DUF4397 domain-containing protein [Niabella hirudinis]|uniref:DUF4397 domain-containing protein n=1 Tax=Niabella hirudinis TaxID=1285929 RepID=UPI003EBE788F
MKKVFLGSSLLLTLALLSSCLKDRDNYYESPEFQNAAVVSIINGAPLSNPLDIQFKGTQRWLLNEFYYTYRTNYTRVYSGDRTLYVFNRGESDSLFSKNVTFEPKKRYSIFIVDTLSKMSAVLVRDSVMAPKGDSVLLRLANMSPDAGPVDLYIQGNTTPVAQHIGYKNVSTFVSFKSEKDIKFEVRAAGTNTVLATSDLKNLYNGNQYTIWTSGYKSMHTDNGKLIVETMAHYY